MDQWKAAHATDTPHRTLAEAMVGADVVIGLSAKGAITREMVATMAPNPIIFAMANPDPEITPEDVQSVRSDAIIATGRSDYANQVNNVLAFPYLFRGALDVRARQINHEMKVACAQALAALAREDVPDEVAAAYRGRKLKFGRDYIIPTPFDPRLIWFIPPFVAQAAMDTGVARKPIEDMDAYRASLRQRLDPSAALMQNISGAVRAAPNKRVVFAEGEETAVIRAAWGFKQAELGTPILLGREELIRKNAAYGLMQVMPGTAAELSGDRGFVSTPERLYDPSVNARMGQAYVNRVLARPEIKGDLLRVAASYNAGPGPMMAAVRKLGPDADPLLLIETIDVPQARDYVEKVVAAYWIYQRMNGRPLNTLDAVASGAPLVPLSLDFVPPPPEPVQPVEVAAVLTTGG